MIRIGLAITVCLAAVGSAPANVVTFDDLAAGSHFGDPEYAPGDGIFAEDGIAVSVEEYRWSPGQWAFHGPVEIVPVGGADQCGLSYFGQAHLAQLSNISIELDFTGLGFDVNYVSFEYANCGGSENIGVNGGYVWYQAIFLAPADIAPGVTLSTREILSDGQWTGCWHAELRGPVENLRLGGQEFIIDNIVALPCEIEGDIDRDGDVDVHDLAELLANYKTADWVWPREGDVDGDADVDISDLGALLANYGEACDGSGPRGR